MVKARAYDSESFLANQCYVVCVISLVLGIHCFKRNLCKYYEKKYSHLLNEKTFFSYRLKLQMFL